MVRVGGPGWSRPISRNPLIVLMVRARRAVLQLISTDPVTRARGVHRLFESIFQASLDHPDPSDNQWLTSFSPGPLFGPPGPEKRLTQPKEGAMAKKPIPSSPENVSYGSAAMIFAQSKGYGR